MGGTNKNEAEIASNIYKNRVMKTIYFENSVLGRALGLMWMKYGNYADKVEALTAIRKKNDAWRRI